MHLHTLFVCLSLLSAERRKEGAAINTSLMALKDILRAKVSKSTTTHHYRWVCETALTPTLTLTLTIILSLICSSNMPLYIYISFFLSFFSKSKLTMALKDSFELPMAKTVLIANGMYNGYYRIASYRDGSA